MCHVRPTIPLRELFYVLYQGKKVKRLAFFKSFLKFVWFFKNDNFSTQKKEEFSIILITYDDYCSITKNLWLKGDEQPNEIISAILCKPLHMKSLSSSPSTHTHTGGHFDLTFAQKWMTQIHEEYEEDIFGKANYKDQIML